MCVSIERFPKFVVVFPAKNFYTEISERECRPIKTKTPGLTPGVLFFQEVRYPFVHPPAQASTKPGTHSRP